MSLRFMRVISGDPTEYNDCTVRALAAIADITYEFAHEIAESLGRHRLKGTQFSKLADYAGMKFESATKEAYSYHSEYGRVRSFHANQIYPTLTQWVKDHPKGRYVVRVPQHVFAVIDGVIHDSFPQSGRLRVRGAYRYDN